MKNNEWQKAMSKSPKNEKSFLGSLVLFLVIIIPLAWFIEATDTGSKEQIHEAGHTFTEMCADMFYAIDEAFDLDEEEGFFDGTKYEGLEKSEDRPKKETKKKNRHD